MDVAASSAVLCVVQGGLVLAPARGGAAIGRRALGLLLPAAMLAIGIGLLQWLSVGPKALAILGWVATPLLAAALGFALRTARPWLGVLLALLVYLAAWQLPSLAGEAAATGLVAMACLTLAALVRLLAPACAIQIGLIVLVALDIFLVWGTHQVAPASTALAQTLPPRLHLPFFAARRLPALQQVTFGSVQFGWLDLLAPALLGVSLVRRDRLPAAVATTVAALAWSALLAVSSTIPATVPVLAGLAVARQRGSKMPWPPSSVLKKTLASSRWR